MVGRFPLYTSVLKKKISGKIVRRKKFFRHGGFLVGIFQGVWGEVLEEQKSGPGKIWEDLLCEPHQAVTDWQDKTCRGWLQRTDVHYRGLRRLRGSAPQTPLVEPRPTSRTATPGMRKQPKICSLDGTDVHYRGLRRLGGSAPQTPPCRVCLSRKSLGVCDWPSPRSLGRAKRAREKIFPGEKNFFSPAFLRFSAERKITAFKGKSALSLHSYNRSDEFPFVCCVDASTHKTPELITTLSLMKGGVSV